MESLTLKPPGRVEGVIQLPGSKSLSNRLLLLSSLASGSTEVRNLLESDDTQHMTTALETLGIGLTFYDEGARCVVESMGGPFSVKQADLFLGNAGTAIRPLCASLCLGEGEFTLTGEPRMLERPIAHLVDALRQLGADITYEGAEGYPPLRIRANGLRGGAVSIRGNVSSQYLTSLLLASPLAHDALQIDIIGDLVSKPYIDMTIDVMRRYGVSVDNHNYQAFRVPRGQTYKSPGTALVEGDASSASYFLSAAAILGGTVRVNGVGADSIQGDVQHAEILERMGAIVQRGPDFIEVSRGSLRGMDLDLNHIPDAAMTLAVTALFAEGKTVIRNIGNWRVKETDRLAAMATELRKVGALVIEGPDYLEIDPPDQIQPAEIATYSDHRMAMSFSLASLGSAEITILDPGCVSKTFPEYFDNFRAILPQ
ncbi:MAG: 3-phosphoshikimate 1-carboxyvinyltransferase [Chloroflexi bacterium]|nr:3-phosphoshikimate 1-carboxyvinyltransferase [Chloroflexota bacterium]